MRKRNRIPSTVLANLFEQNKSPLTRACSSLYSHNHDLSPKGRGVHAFTLAEVLITLGIIGIVAAMTIPTLISNYQSKAWNTSANVFEKKLEQALRVMNTQSSLAGHPDTQSFVNELSKHIKITKVCKPNELSECIEDNVTWEIVDITGGSESETYNLSNLKTAKLMGKTDWNSETLGLQFANGTTALIAYNDYDCTQDPYSNQVRGTSCLSMIYDTSGFKSPNTTSKDVRAINAKLASCAFKSGSTCFSAPFQPDPVTKAECEKMKNDLGISECYYDKDYWAGAVKRCGGINKMPTTSHSNRIASYIYKQPANGSLLCPEDEVSGNITDCFNKNAAASIGFSHIEGLWLNTHTEDFAARALFMTLQYMTDGTDRDTSDISAICIDN